MAYPDALPDSPLVVFPERCPGCEDYDPRHHTEKWCSACLPEDGSHGRWPTGDCDRAVRVPTFEGAHSATDPENQRAASRLWGQDAAVAP